jgi:hypothetical protein
MSFGPQRPGAFAEPEEPSEPTSAKAPEVADGYETHLCVTCIHATVCAVAAAVRTLGADGQLVISKCAAFYALPTEPVT